MRRKDRYAMIASPPTVCGIVVALGLFAGSGMRADALRERPQVSSEKARRTPAQQKINSQLLY